MKKVRVPKGPKTLFDKVKDKDATFASQVYSMTDEALKAKIISCEEQVETVEEAKENDADMKETKEKLNTMNESYSEPLKTLKLKKRLIMQILKERGKL